MWRRLVSLGLMLAFLLVTSIPLVPATMLCAHASGDVSDTKHGHHVLMQDDLDMSSMVLQHGEVVQQTEESSVLLPRQTLRQAEKACRIECGCGCHRDVHSVPHLLAPHLYNSNMKTLAEPELAPVFSMCVSGDGQFVVVPVPPPDHV